jgi:hypothetical protein
MSKTGRWPTCKLSSARSCVARKASSSVGKTAPARAAYIPLRFAFQSREPIQINREWLELLTRAANSTGGLRFVPEVAEKVEAVEAVGS